MAIAAPIATSRAVSAIARACDEGANAPNAVGCGTGACEVVVGVVKGRSPPSMTTRRSRNAPDP